MEELDLLCVQETGMTDSALAGANAVLKDKHLQVLHSATAQWKRSTQGTWRADVGSTPGVGIVCSNLLDVRLAQVLTEAAAKLVQGGRLCVAEVRTATAPLLLVAAYFPSGANAGAQRIKMMDSILAEVVEQSRCLVVLAGDFNEDWSSSPLPLMAAHAGLRQVMWQELLPERQYTYKCSATKSCLDYFFVSLPVSQACSRPVIDWGDRLQHALVHFSVSCVRRMLTIRRVPRFVDCAVTRIDERVSVVHWPPFELRVDELLEACRTQDAYNLWVVSVRQLMFPDGHQLKGSSLPGHIVEPVAISARRRSPCGGDVRSSDVWRAYLMLEGRVQFVADDVRAALSALGTNLRVPCETVINAPLLYADEVRRAYRLFVRDMKKNSVASWRARMRQSWQQGGALVFRWVKQKTGVLTLAIREGGAILTAQHDILDALHQYWCDVFQHGECSFESFRAQVGYHNVVVDDELVCAFLQRVRSVPKSKAGGMDGFNPSHLRALDVAGARVLLKVMATAVTTQRWPKELCSVKLRLIPK
eukprot:1758191-Amphidinium_carterae.1